MTSPDPRAAPGKRCRSGAGSHSDLGKHAPQRNALEHFHVHFTPTYGSWINLVERWFAELTNKRIRRGVFRSVKELEAAIREYIDLHNEDPNPLFGQKWRIKSWPASLVTPSAQRPRKALTYDTNHWDRRLARHIKKCPPL